MPSRNGFLHLARPLGPAAAGTQPATTPLSVVIQPQALFSILDHSTRRPADQHRVIGTLLGTRSDTDETLVTVHSAFAVGHTETTDQVEVDMECQKSMLSLHLRANPKEILVGWYATSSELNTFSALIQNHYSSPNEGTFPYPAVHLTVSSEPGQDIEINTYISSPVGTTDERAADSAAFIPVPHTVNYTDSDRAGIDALTGAKDVESRSANIMTDIENLEKSLEDTIGMLDRVGRYVEAVIEEEAEPSTALGQYLLNTLALAPKVDATEIEKDFNNHIQDVLTVSYLANTIRSQMDLSNRLATAQLTLGSGTEGGSGKDGDNKGGNKRQGGDRGDRGQNRQNRGESVSAGGL
jgi:translation initiation factor 3 subunit F